MPTPRRCIICNFLFSKNIEVSNPSDYKKERIGTESFSSWAQVSPLHRYCLFWHSNEQTLSLCGHGDYNVTTGPGYGYSHVRCLVRSGSKTGCVIHKQLAAEWVLIISVHSYIKDAGSVWNSTVFYWFLMLIILCINIIHEVVMLFRHPILPV
jgi:hypothetical protein